MNSRQNTGGSCTRAIRPAPCRSRNKLREPGEIRKGRTRDCRRDGRENCEIFVRARECFKRRRRHALFRAAKRAPRTLNFTAEKLRLAFYRRHKKKEREGTGGERRSTLRVRVVTSGIKGRELLQNAGLHFYAFFLI